MPVVMGLGHIVLTCNIMPNYHHNVACRRGRQRMSCNASAGKGKLTTEVTFNPFREVSEKDGQSPCPATHGC